MAKRRGHTKSGRLVKRRRISKKRPLKKRRQRKSGRRRGRSQIGRGKSKFGRAICRLRRLSPNQQVKALSSSNDSFVRSLCSKVKKLRHAKLSPQLSQRLRRNAKTIRKLINAKTSMSKKRKILSQRGGIAPLLLAALPALGSLLGGLFRG